MYINKSDPNSKWRTTISSYKSIVTILGNVWDCWANFDEFWEFKYLRWRTITYSQDTVLLKWETFITFSVETENKEPKMVTTAIYETIHIKLGIWF